jgi:hypothetical protein
MTELDENVIEQSESVRSVRFPDARGGYELTCSWDLCQAVGEVDGVDFYFHAKHGQWTFDTEDAIGHLFPPAHPLHFRRGGRFAEFEPGMMRLDWATPIVRRCVAEFIAQATPGKPPARPRPS